MEIINFLSELKWNAEIQFVDGTCKNVIPKYNKIDKLKDAYFVTGHKTWTGKHWRVMDVDIETKKYFAIDVDIRKTLLDKTGKIPTDIQLEKAIEKILELFDNDELLQEYSYAVNSWNGLHIYYIWEERTIDPFIYRSWVWEIYSRVNNVLSPLWLKADGAVKNISTLLRIPGCMNTGRQKYGLAPVEAKIIRNHPKHSSLFDNIEVYAMSKLEEEREVARKSFNDNKVYDAIEQVNVAHLFSKNTGLRIANDWRNFISSKDGWYIWLYYIKDLNILVNNGTSHLYSDLNAYWPFSYVKYEILRTSDNKAVYKWFKEEYPNISDIDKVEKKEYHIKKDKINGVDNLVRDDRRWEQIFDLNRKGKVFISRWLPEIDNEFGKIQEHDLVVLVGSPASGKTAFTYFMARENAKQWLKSMYFSLELNPSVLKMRTAMAIARISKIDYQNGNYSVEQWNIASKIYNELDDSENIDLVGYSYTPNINEVCSAIENAYLSDWIRLFFLDNLWKILWTTGSQSENDVQIEITNKLQSLKNKYPIAIVLLHHLRKKSNTDTSVTQERVRWSQKISDNATVLAWIDRDWSVSTLSLMKDTMWWIETSVNMTYVKWEFIPYTF